MIRSSLRRKGVVYAVIILSPIFAAARSNRLTADRSGLICATGSDYARNIMAKSRYLESRGRLELQRRRLLAQPAEDRVLADSGDVALIEDDGSILVQPNAPDLAGKSFRFEPDGASAYKVVARSTVFDGAGVTSLPLTDDDSRSVDLGFTFTYFGKSYTSVFCNSDGNLTFEARDVLQTRRDLSRFVSRQPRIGPFFSDLDPPSGLVGFRTDADGITFVWQAVPILETPDFNSFSVRLARDNTIEFVYAAKVDGKEAVVGISPGSSQGSIHAIKFSRDLPTDSLAGSIVEVFSTSETFSESELAKKFYQTHGDDFDQLVLFMAFSTNAPPFDRGFAYEVNVANEIRGIGDSIFDFSDEFGSQGRLRSFVNMGPLSGPRRYPADPHQVFFGTNSTMGILGQEAGHRWLAFLPFQDGSTVSKAILGRDQGHWSFFFDTDSSVMEGNDIEDRGAERGDSRFATIGATTAFSPLDQYVMGLRAKDDVPGMFLVQSPAATDPDPERSPELGVVFGGTRKEITIDSIVAANGARSPTVDKAQKVFRQAFILLSRKGEQPSADSIAKVQGIRDAWVKFFNEATGGRAWIVTELQNTPGTTSSEIHFPYFKGDSKRFTGIALANWGKAAADVLFTARDNSGAVTSSPSHIVNPKMITIGPGQQVAMLAEQIHGLGFGDTRDGWISAKSTSSQVTGFFLDGDSDLKLLDGAVAGAQTGTELYFTRGQSGGVFGGGSFKNLIDVVNPGSQSATLTLEIIDEFGAIRSSAARTVSAQGRLAEEITSLFPNVSLQNAYVRVSSNVGVVGYQSIDGAGTIFALPAQPAGTASKLYSAQFASGGAGGLPFFTDVTLVNTSGASRTVRFELIGNNGSPVAGATPPASVTIPARGVYRVRGETLFNLQPPTTATTLTEGTLVVTADGTGIVGDVAFGDPISERFLASLPLDGAPISSLIFSQVAQGGDFGSPYFTGIAMYNPGSTDVTVTIDVFSEKGDKTGTASIALPRGNRISRTLPQLVPAVTSQIRGYIRVGVTGGSIVAFELFGDQSLEFLAAVPPQAITP